MPRRGTACRSSFSTACFAATSEKAGEHSVTRLLVSSASGTNGRGYGAVLAFNADGDLLGPFSEDGRISDPRGLGTHPTADLIYVNSGDDRVLALYPEGEVALDSGCIPDLDPGG